LKKLLRLEKAAALAPILRGFCSSSTKMIGHFTDDERVLQFINSNDLDRLAPMGTSCPDHFLRTKISPLVLNLTPDESLNDVKAIQEKIAPLFEAYRNMYSNYYQTCKHDNSPAIATPILSSYCILVWVCLVFQKTNKRHVWRQNFTRMH
jgi:rhamnose utilization protein RhaD (predicted bifunctional aldolase and dehydrogenase)